MPKLDDFETAWANQKIFPESKKALLDEPIAISSPAISNDLRFGSELVTRPWWPAAPGIYGLHENSITDGRVRAPNGAVLSPVALYASQPWIFATVMRFRAYMQVVPPKVYRRDDTKGRVRLRSKDHPLAAAIHHPWRGGDANDLIDSILCSMLVYGNAAVRIESGPRESIRFTPMDWGNLFPMQVSAHYVSGWTFRDEAFDEERTLTPDEVLHIAWNSPSGPLGVSPLSPLAATLTAEIAAQQYAINNLKNGAPGGRAAIVTDPEFFGGLEQDERDAILAEIREQVTAKYVGVENGGVPAILPPGLNMTSVPAHTAHDAQLIEMRKLNREEVEGVYLMPPPMVGQLDNATYSNIETQKEMAYQDTLAPQATKIAKAINTQIAYEIYGDEDVYVEVDLNGVMQGNARQRWENYQTGFNIGTLTRNEIRERENLDRITDDPTADKYFVQANNMAPAESLTNQSADTAGND